MIVVQGVTNAGMTGAQAGRNELRLIRAAHDFEAQMLKELLKPLASGDGLTAERDGSTGVLGEFAAEALGRGLSEQGGFGIADRILDQFSRPGNGPGTGAVTGNRHFDTGIRGS